MTFTYNETASPSFTDLARLRKSVGDTESEDPLLTDEEMNDIILQFPSIAQASVKACEDIIAELSRRVARSVAGVNASGNTKFDHYKELLPELKSRARIGNVAAHAGHTSKSRVRTARQDTNLTVTTFEVGQDDFSGTRRNRIDEGCE